MKIIGNTLPTNKDIYKISSPKSNSELMGAINQHLYFTTDEEIKEGDWAYNIVQRTYFMVSKSFMKLIGNTLPTNKKTIATTNTKLNLGICEDCKQDKDYRHNFIKCTCSLPQPSQAFIEAFCNAGGIWKVLVEYTDWCDYDDDDATGIDRPDLRLKVNSNNEIIIHSVKDSWTKKELIGNGIDSLDNFLMNSVIYTQEQRELVMQVIYEWTEESL